MAKMYRDAVAKHQKTVQKYLQEMKEVSSSDDEEPAETSVLENVLRNYHSGGGDTVMIARTRILLEESVSGRTPTCLICIGSIKRAHSIWNCEHCYACFHLSCIQKWSNDSISLRSEENHGPIAVIAPKKIEWCCPKCRYSYTKEQIPQKYKCYCGKLDDPPLHPWLIPHSCGEICHKLLSIGGNCQHKCLLLCHPGPCPPCPQMVTSACYCEQERKKVRCSVSKWSCGQTCNKILSCNSHKCQNICHDGECPLCSYTSIQWCCCGSEKMERPCNDAVWQCKKICNKLYSCGYHKCENVCHGGECGLCPNSGLKSCPCGTNQRYVECPDVMETCVSTCGIKHLDCDHTCPEKCHKGPCPPCQVVVDKKCLCGTHSRSLPCSREFKCETKCRGLRTCRKHACGKRCCTGQCPPCEKICDKPLQCGRHKCTMICHLGPCYPCTRESKITCRCKETVISVPCGREKHVKPPKCNLPCKIKYKCGHNDENKHYCHFGDCPSCIAICDKPYESCEHICKSRCHAAVPIVFKQAIKPATPWEVQPPKTKIMALECPLCVAPVTKECFGKHEMIEQPCHLAKRRSCGRLCGRSLSCGNHTCSMLCHLIENDPDYPDVPSSCEPCNYECVVPRPGKCSHKCALRSCHPGPCPPCEILERCVCHCGITELYVRCKELLIETDELLSCKQQCSKYLECGHRCKNICHPGICSNQICMKKTKTYCPCGNIKKELLCHLIRCGGAQVQCDDSCEEKKRAAQSEKERAERRRQELEMEKNRRELEEYEWKLGKKKKYKEKKMPINKSTNKWNQKIWMILLPITIAVGASMYFIFYTEI